MTAGTRRLVLGVDSGGSGLRVALAEVSGPLDPSGGTDRAGAAGPPGGTGSSQGGDGAAESGPSRARTGAEILESRVPVRTGPGGIDAQHLLEQVLPMARTLLERAAGRDLAAGAVRARGEERTVEAVAVGAAGMASLGGRLRAELPGALATSLGVRRLALAADAVTAYAGALGQRPGAVVAAGTGMIALGTDLSGWRRADGWGHLLGDCGSGAWIGRAGLEAALRAHDGRRGGSAALLAAAEAVFGQAPRLPGMLYPRPDRPAVLASFAPEVARCAAGGDPVSADVLARAAAHIAESAAAVCPPLPPGAPGNRPLVALTGGLFRTGDPLLVPLRAELAVQLPYAQLVPASGDPLSGALLIASALATGSLRLPRESGLLHVPPEQG
ncbi:N-acetylglucosamine kinase [Streptomyces sp. NPDC004609]|uniref:N-acetylglucosamine kinase n=1 Tax=Streptomyces sp. NPDC004609 TaxID=3364704 RepID=UPI0036A4835B